MGLFDGNAILELDDRVELLEKQVLALQKSLINKEPPVKTRIIKAWQWNFNKGIRPLYCPEFTNTQPIDRELHLWIELTGTY